MCGLLWLQFVIRADIDLIIRIVDFRQLVAKMVDFRSLHVCVVVVFLHQPFCRHHSQAQWKPQRVVVFDPCGLVSFSYTTKSGVEESDLVAGSVETALTVEKLDVHI